MTRVIVLAATFLTIATLPVCAGLITVQATHNVHPGNFTGPLDPFRLISSAVPGTGGGGAAIFTGRYRPVSGIYSVPGNNIIVPIMEVSELSFTVPDPSISATTSGFFISHELIITIFDSELGEIGTIDIEEGGTGGTNVNRAFDPITGAPAGFVGSALITEQILSLTSLTPGLTPGGSGFLGGTAFSREINGTTYTINLVPGNAGSSSGFSVSGLAPDTPLPSLMTLGLNIEVNRVVPEPGTFAMFVIGGAVLAAPTWLRRRKGQQQPGPVL